MGPRSVKCRRCGKIFHVSGTLGQLCPNCIRDEEEIYLKVRSFVKDNPGVSAQEVSEILSVSRAKIMTYIKEERLEVTSDSKALISCKNCGKPITTGVFCADCKRVYADVQKADAPPKLTHSTENAKTFKAGSSVKNNH